MFEIMPKINLSALSVVTILLLSLFPGLFSGISLNIAAAQQNSTSIASTNNNSTNFLTYSNSTYGIRIQYPSSWLKEESHNQTSNDIVKFSAPAAAAPASLNIVGGKPAPQSIPLAVYINASIYLLRHSFDNFSLIDSNATTLGDSPAQKIVYTARLPASGIELKFMQIFTIKDSKSFVITFGSLPTIFSTYLPSIQKMVDSFAFIPVVTPPALNTAQSSNKTYTNATDGITLSIPQGWSITDGQNAANATDLKVAYVYPPIALDPQAAVSVIIYKDTQPSSNSSLDGYLRDSIVFYRDNIPGFKLGSANTGFRLSNQSAYTLVYTWTSSDTGMMKTLEAAMLLNGQGYYIHYNAPIQLFSKFLPQVNQMIGSLNVRPPSQ
jgi:hypothetical protein